MTAARPSTAVLRPLRLQCLNRIGQQTRGMHLGQLYNPKLYNPWRCCHSVGKGWGGGTNICDCSIVQFSVSLGSYTGKRIFPVHMITNG